MKHTTPARQSGLSLVELLLGLAITALVLRPLLPMVQTASAAARIGGDQVALEREADFAIDRISERIRAVDPSNQLSGTPSDWLKPTVYVLSNGTLYEQQKGINYALAESVTDFSLTAPASAGGRPVIQVSLTLTRGDAPNVTSTNASATVRMGGLQ